VVPELARGRDVGRPQDRLILASTSPQRRAILEQLRIPFEVVTPSYVEDDPPGVAASELVRVHAEGKARSARVEGRVTLGVDTAVVLDGRTYGKPADRADAERMLDALAGRTHTVVSGVCLLGPELEVVADEATEVTFRPLSQSLRDAYLASGEWEGRAGAYAIQGLGSGLVDSVRGDVSNVIGLPVPLLLSLAPELFQSA
jgi:septum formation protein